MEDQEFNHVFEVHDVPQFESTLEAAQQYLSRGIKTIPLQPRSKKPAIADWRTLRLSEEDLPKTYPAESNIGVLTGNANSNLVCADLDFPEDHEIADLFLPPTGLEGGRESKPRSHLFYSVDGPLPKSTLRFADPTISDERRAMIAELLVNNQVVIAPSVYSNGEKCVWHNFGEPTRIAATTLVNAISVLAVVILISRQWRRGIRHAASLILAGVLAHAGYSRDEVKKIIAAICRLAKDEEAVGRLTDVDTTFDKFEHGEQVSGWPTLEEEGLFDPKVIKKLKAWLPPQPRLKKKAKPSVADVVREILSKVDFILLESKEVFATYPTDAGKRTCLLDSEEFSSWVRGYFFNNYDYILESGTLKNILPIFARSARLTDQQVHLRVAQGEEGIVYIDLGNPDQEVVEITPGNWKITKVAPIIFREGSGSKPLPRPERGGQIEDLTKFFNLRSAGEMLLLITWIVAALWGAPPFHILVLLAEQGSGKSFMTWILHELIDPNVGERRTKPASLNDLIVAAYNNYLIELDNISSFLGWLSDTLCQLATGGAFAKRGLYTNLGEITFSAARPIIVNGIVDPTSRPDFLDRALFLRPPRITDNRREYSELKAEFIRNKARILGALYDLLSLALKYLPDVPKPADPPRFINFARVGVAVEKALGGGPGLFEQAYKESRDLAMEKALETSSVAQAIINFMAKKEPWRGKAGKLWSELNEWMPWHQRSSDWPRSHKGMSDALNRLAPALRNCGIEILRSEKPTKNSFIYTLKRTELWDDANVTEEVHEIDGSNFLRRREE